MGTYQRKTGSAVNRFHIGHQPRVGRVASFAIAPGGLLVYIGVAGIAIGFGTTEFQIGMTLPATHHFVLPHQRETGFGVVKRHFALIHLPAFGRMTACTLQFEVCTVRTFSRLQTPDRAKKQCYK